MPIKKSEGRNSWEWGRWQGKKINTGGQNQEEVEVGEEVGEELWKKEDKAYEMHIVDEDKWKKDIWQSKSPVE